MAAWVAIGGEPRVERYVRGGAMISDEARLHVGFRVEDLETIMISVRSYHAFTEWAPTPIITWPFCNSLYSLLYSNRIRHRQGHLQVFLLPHIPIDTLALGILTKAVTPLACCQTQVQM